MTPVMMATDTPAQEAPVVPSVEMRTEFWDASVPADHRSWMEHWEAWPGREISAHPDYVALFARPGDRVMAIALKTSRGGALYPVIVRPLASEPWATGEEGTCDLTNAYGYGGPYAWELDATESARFLADLEAWTRKIGAVTSFARLSLFPDEILPFPGSVVDRGGNIVRSLEPTPDELWRDYEGKVRKNVQRARRDGLEIQFDDKGERLDEFLAVYQSTMDRRQALKQYYFPKSFFETLISRMPGRVLLAHAVGGGKVLSSEMVLLSARTAYFYLGGTLAEAFASRPNDLLKHESFLKCREMGLKRFVLGGSYKAEDGLLRFKKSFAPGGEVPFRVGVAVHDEAASARLVERRRAWELAQGREWAPAEGFFPSYRS